MSSRYSGGVVRKNQLVPTTSSASGVWNLGEATQATKADIWPYSGIAMPIQNSLRFRASNSAYLTRSASSTNRKTFTFSCWVKRGTISSDMLLLSVGGSDTTRTLVYIDSANTMRFLNNFAGAGYVGAATSAVLRDPSAWYHLIYAIDTTQATAANRVKLYINGVQQSTSTVNITQNEDTYINTGATHYIGRSAAGQSSTDYFDGYMTDVYLIDGQALDPSYFGQTSAITGVWEPKPYTGTYGTNGFHLEFKDTSVGHDTSGNNNDWTPNNISTTNDTTYDLMLDVPTQWSPRDGSQNVRGNYATWNRVAQHYPWAIGDISEGNLKAYRTLHGVSVATMGIKSPTYWEVTIGNTNQAVGIISSTSAYAGTYSYDDPTAKGVYLFTIPGYVNGGGIVSSGGPLAADSGSMTLMFAVDPQNGKMWVGKNGTWNGNPSAGTGAFWTNLSTSIEYTPWDHSASTAQANDAWINCGQRPFAYTPPTGFKNLCTTNLPT
jgi:hypothetical protein